MHYKLKRGDAMAKVEMKKISIYGLKKNRKEVMEKIQRLGVIQIEDLKLSDSVFDKQNTSQSRHIFDKNADIAREAVAVLNSYIPEGKSLFSTFEGRKEISVEDYYNFVSNDTEIMRIAYDIYNLQKQISDKKADIIRYETQKESLLLWKTLDISMSFTGTKTTTAFIGTVVGNMNEYKIKEYISLKLPETDDYIVEVIGNISEQTCVFVLCHNSVSEKISAVLRELGFARPLIQAKQPPCERIQILDKKINDAKRDIKQAEINIESYIGTRNALKFISDYYKMRSEKYQAIECLSQSKRTFILTGYITEKESQKLEKILVEQYGVAVEIENPSDDEDVPVLLKNNAFGEPCESVLETYSMPNKKEIDPTSVMAVFYYILFGLMFSDAGYGLIMVLVCGFALIKFKNMEQSLKRNIKLFFGCGITTIFWGLMFGSFFGDSVNSIAATFFNSNISLPPIWFEPLTNPMPMLMFSFGIGIVHLFAGLGISCYQSLKQRKYYDALCDSILWYLLVGGLILYFVTTDMFIGISGMNFGFPYIVSVIGIVCAVIGAIGILLTAGRDSKNPVKRLMKGAYGLYNITGYLSDILSYSRLLALGLATSVIGTVFNKMASMIAGVDNGGIIGIILYIVVFVIGHTLNFGINVLGAYVHTNRLQFVEFFGKFYNGDGRKFTPYKINTKNYKIKEEI